MASAEDIARSAMSDAAARAQDMTLSDEERAEALREVLNTGSQLVAIDKKREIQRLQASQRGLGAKMLDLLLPRERGGRIGSGIEKGPRGRREGRIPSVAEVEGALPGSAFDRLLGAVLLDPRNPRSGLGVLDKLGRVPGLRGLDPLGNLKSDISNPRSVTRKTGETKGEAGLPIERLFKAGP